VLVFAHGVEIFDSLAGMRRRLELSLVLVSLALVACKPAVEAPSETPSDAPKQGSAPSSDAGAKLLIFDAGSSGTRAHVYAAGEGPGGLVDLTPECNDGRPLAEAGPAAALELLPCLEAQLPASEWAATPARVYATAGMRSLAETEPDRVAEIHLETAAALYDRGFGDVESRTIAGNEEAHFAWIASNLGPAGLNETSMGILELGGSSTQIAFVPADPADATETLELDGRSYPLFAVSYLHCGANDARLDMAVSSCFFPGCEDDEACAASLADTPAQTGAGDFGACGAAISTVLGGAEARCPAAAEARPPMQGREFVLLSTFAYLFVDYGAVREGRADPAALWAEAGTACPTSWSKLGAPLSEVSSSYRGKSCFNAALTQELLELYGLDQSSELRVLDQNPEWTLGAAYLEREGQR
jgi:hypothetical protein